MRLYILIFFCSLLAQISVFAQQDKHDSDEIEKEKIAYVQQNLQLSEAQKKIFLPLYTQWQNKEHNLRRGRVQRFLRFRTQEEIDAMSNAAVNKAIDEEMNFRLRLMQLERYYLSKIRAVIPPKKVVEMFRLQESFKRDLLRQYRKGSPKKP